jgi:hypothetical protein
MVFPRLGKEISQGDLIVGREVQQLQREARNVLDFALSLPDANSATPDCAKSSAPPKSAKAEPR